MAYATPASFTAGTPGTAAQMNVLRSDFEEVAKAPVAWAYSTANQSIANGTNVNVNLAATYVLRNITFASNTLTLVETGVYLAVVHFNWVANTTGLRSIRFLINGAISSEVHATPGAATLWTQHALTAPFIGNAGNTLTIQAYQDSGGALNLTSGSSIFVHMLSRT